MAPPDRYSVLKEQWQGHTTNATTYTNLISELHSYLNGEMPLDKAPAFLARLQTAVGDEFDKALAQAANLAGGDEGDVGGVGGALSVLTRLRDAETGAANDLLEPLFFASPQQFRAEFGEGAAQLQVLDAPGGGGGTVRPFDYKSLPDGTLIEIDNIRGGFKVVGNFGTSPADTIMQDDRGNLVAISPSGRIRVIQEGFGFARIDPERTFALEALQTDIAFRGLELTQRGLEIQALGQDFANQILIGRMTFEQAQLNLNRVNSAFDVRRQEREIALSFAVKQSSIRVLPSGERVTRLPFAEQIAGILDIPIEEFELPVGEVNPEAAAQALLDATAFESPIPALQQQAADTQAAVSAILDAPLDGLPAEAV